MTYALYMSTDEDITHTPLNAAWNPVTACSWAQIRAANLDLPAGATIVVLAHGNGDEIGNADPGTIDIDATTFLALIQGNMHAGVPAKIYISTCGHRIAEFAANVRHAAEQNDIWDNTEIYGHADPVEGPVPPPNDIGWYQIF